MRTYKTVNAYIAAAPKAAQPMLRTLRRVIRAAAPEAEEKLSYGMPYYGYNGRLAYFAAFRDHVSLFVMGVSQKMYLKELKAYKRTKATIHFPLGTKIPLGLVRKLILARLKENEAKKS